MKKVGHALLWILEEVFARLLGALILLSPLVGFWLGGVIGVKLHEGKGLSTAEMWEVQSRYGYWGLIVGSAMTVVGLVAVYLVRRRTGASVPAAADPGP